MKPGAFFARITAHWRQERAKVPVSEGHVISASTWLEPWRDCTPDGSGDVTRGAGSPGAPGGSSPKTFFLLLFFLLKSDVNFFQAG